MNKSSIKIKSQYFQKDINVDEYDFEIEKEWNDRPAWLKVINPPARLPRFLSIVTTKYGESIYKAFGNYYFPLDYTNAEEQRFMNGVAKDYDEMVGKKFNFPMAEALVSKIEVEQISKEANILDLGCGTGILSRMLADIGLKHFTLVDFSEKMLSMAKKKLKGVENARFICSDIKTLPPEGEFDLVASVMLFNSFNEKDTEKIISNIYKQLKSGGFFAVLEDKSKKAYSKYFKKEFSGMVDTGLRKKYIFIGRKKIN